jgi:hypothetical protein
VERHRPVVDAVHKRLAHVDLAMSVKKLPLRPDSHRSHMKPSIRCDTTRAVCWCSSDDPDRDGGRESHLL